MKAERQFVHSQLLAKLGSGFDIVSGGELEMLRDRRPGDRIVFSGVGKTARRFDPPWNIVARRKRRARCPRKTWPSRAGILLFNVESESELEVFQEEAAREVAI